MSLYRRKDSDKWWMWLEGAKPRSTGVLHSTGNVYQDRENKKEALKHYHDAMADLHRQRRGEAAAPKRLTFGAFADWYEAHVIGQHRGGPRELEMLRTLRRAFGALQLANVSREAVTEWRTARVVTVSTRTAEREIDLLKAMLKQATALGHIPASPLAAFKRLPHTPPKRRLMLPDEERRLLKVATPIERAILLIARDGLVRLNDVLDIARADDSGDWIYVRAPKGVKVQPYEFPVSPRLRAALDALPVDGAHYFEAYRLGDDLQRRHRVAVMLRHLCKRAGVPYGRKQGGLTFHWATRTTGTTDLIVRKGVDPKTVQAIGNWKHAAVVMEIYAQRDREAMRRAVGQNPPTSRLRLFKTKKKRA